MPAAKAAEVTRAQRRLVVPARVVGAVYYETLKKAFDDLAEPHIQSWAPHQARALEGFVGVRWPTSGCCPTSRETAADREPSL
ncbi:hypothetical protein GCM10022245_40300 [Streptomyces mayteni]